ncbi:TRAP transporter substrate-binding protein DctP [Pusillimonas noertemannii]|uniref:TRAP-type C4-dicarboxylate transport system substrate-binding protein n=1 Tax=Pusillimonas noertemannii TaxID=305977 RepID=A0A2U1CST1_9BURK|nr:TRAP transporter substrate-binding protein DctP [Pusillimonas noertemannii]NYT70542.1 TRAP transporter substrate-binding protein DctP [Pusillimonas noertemannii]PVY68947.1 TRAP-type C4-dicarboxylate transport system substrate-binding protein [Pusillimonas noertemannii]TFL11610.1 ABC transporter substrate-binding protein [Pusillimonas noertemannii]
MKTLLRSVLVSACFAVTSIAPVNAETVTLRAVSAWPEGNFFSQNFEKFIKKVNEDGKGVVQIQYLGGGAKVMPPFEVGNAIKTGVIDMANVTGNFYTNLLPEADALSVSTIPVQEWDKNGAREYIDQVWGDRLNALYLGRAIDQMPYHLFLKKPITGADLKDLRLRGIPIYRYFFETLGATVLTIAPGELYTALERGVVDGYGWPVSGLFDLSLQEQTKYRVEPGFYNTEVGVLINQDKWNKLNDQQKEILTQAARWMEDLNLQNAQMWEEEKKRQAAAGIEVIELSAADRETYLKAAEESVWSNINRLSPQHGPKLRELLVR